MWPHLADVVSNPTEAIMPKLLKYEDILSVFKIAPRTLRRWVAESDFPRPIRVGKSRRWYEADIVAYIQSKREAA
jgi:predicted DNA-binding transcriptional regulator AlpA